MEFKIYYRPQPKDDLQTIVTGFSQGNPGAATAILELYKATERRSPLAFGTFILMLEQLRLYGAGIYMLWNDCLGRSICGLMSLIEAWRNDVILNEVILKHVNLEGGRGIPFEHFGPRWLI